MALLGNASGKNRVVGWDFGLNMLFMESKTMGKIFAAAAAIIVMAGLAGTAQA